MAWNPSAGRRQLLSTSAALAGVALAGAAAAEPHEKAFFGAFKHVGGDKERKARDRAIDDVVAGMSVFARGIARDKLKAANPIAAKIAFSSDGKSLTVTMDARSYTAPLDGSSVKVKSITGDDMDMRFKIAERAVDQIFTGDERGRDNAFRLRESTLGLRVCVHASQLPKDLVYQLTYERT